MRRQIIPDHYERTEQMEQSSTSVDRYKQIDYAKDASTQVITLASAILAVSLTFSKNWAEAANAQERVLLQWSWLTLLVSVLAGVWTLSAIAGIAFLGRGDLRSPSLRVPWLIQIVMFLVGLVLLVVFGWSVI